MSLRVAIFMLNVVSAVMTALGFFPMVRSYFGTILPAGSEALAAAALAFTMSLMVQALVHAYWWRAGLERAWLTGVTAGLLASFLSWTGSAGGFQLMYGQQVMLTAREQRDAAATALPLRDFAVGFAELQAEFTAAAALLRRKADDERAGRPTCSNDSRTGAECGARCRLRAEHAERLAALEAEAAALAAEAGELAIAMTLAPDLAARQALFAEAVRLQANPRQPSLAAALRAVAADYGRELRDAGGRPFVCEDPQTVRRLTELATQAGQRIALPQAAPQAQRIDYSDTLGCVIARLGQLLGRGAGCAEARPDAAMLTAAGLEGLLALLILIEARRKRRFGGAPGWIEHALSGLGKTERRDLGALAQRLERLALYRLDAPPMGRFFALPVDGDETARLEADALVRMLRLGKPAYARVPLAETDPGWVAGRAEAFGGAQIFDLYRWTTEAERLADRAQICALRSPFGVDRAWNFRPRAENNRSETERAGTAT